MNVVVNSFTFEEGQNFTVLKSKFHFFAIFFNHMLTIALAIFTSLCSRDRWNKNGNKCLQKGLDNNELIHKLVNYSFINIGSATHTFKVVLS